MGTSDTDLRTPDGKHTPCVSNHPLLHKKNPKKRKKKPPRGQRVPVSAPISAPPELLGLAQPCSTRAAPAPSALPTLGWLQRHYANVPRGLWEAGRRPGGRRSCRAAVCSDDAIGKLVKERPVAAGPFQGLRAGEQEQDAAHGEQQ